MCRLLSSPSAPPSKEGDKALAFHPAVLDDFPPRGQRAEQAPVNYSLVQGWDFHIPCLTAWERLLDTESLKLF